MDEAEFRAQFQNPVPNPEPTPIPPKPRPSPTLRNAMKQKYTIDEVDAFLLNYHGNIALAAMNMMVTKADLKKFIRSHDQLSKWIPVKTPQGTIIPAIKVREDLKNLPGTEQAMTPVPPNTKDAELTRIAEAENKAINEGIIKLGATKDQAETLMELGKNFKIRHLDAATNFAAVGLATNMLKQQEMLRNLESQIRAGPHPLNVKGDPAVETMLYESYISLSEEFRRTEESWFRAQLVIAKVESLKRAEAKSGRPTAKAGFKPKAASIAV